MTKSTSTKRPARAKAKPVPLAPGMPTDPVRLARWQAIRAAGGASHVGRALGYTKGEAVRLWYVDRDPTAEQARKLVQLSQGAATLQQILPAAFDGLTAAELGYAPA
jgi:hypothetical protein